MLVDLSEFDAGVKFPEALRIGGLTYTVEYGAPQLDRAPSGQCGLAKGQIWINRDMPFDQSRSTLLHEALEAINFLTDLGLKHRQIMQLEHALDALLSANPEFVSLYINHTSVSSMTKDSLTELMDLANKWSSSLADAVKCTRNSFDQNPAE